jgi:hypothetical protein
MRGRKRVGGKQDPRADLVQILPGIDSDPVLITAKAAFPLWGRYARDSLPLAHQQASISLPAAVSSVARLTVKSASWEIPNHCADMDSIGSGCCRPLPFSIIIDRHWGGRLRGCSSPSVCQGQGGFPRTNPPFPGGCSAKCQKPCHRRTLHINWPVCDGNRRFFVKN